MKEDLIPYMRMLNLTYTEVVNSFINRPNFMYVKDKFIN